MSNFNQKFSSNKQDWTTPLSLFNKLNEEFNFTTDLAASKENALCKNYFTEKDNAMGKTWEGTCWLNPPYGAKGEFSLAAWVKKAFNETQTNENSTVVMLIPARTNTKWFHEYCMKAQELRFINGRPKFGNADYGLPQPLVIVIFKKTNNEVKITSFDNPS